MRRRHDGEVGQIAHVHVLKSCRVHPLDLAKHVVGQLAGVRVLGVADQVVAATHDEGLVLRGDW